MERGHKAVTSKMWEGTLVKLRRLRQISMEEDSKGKGKTMNELLDEVLTAEVERQEKRIARRKAKEALRGGGKAE